MEGEKKIKAPSGYLCQLLGDNVLSVVLLMPYTMALLHSGGHKIIAIVVDTV